MTGTRSPKRPDTLSGPTAQPPPCCWTDQEHPMSPSEHQKATGMPDNLLSTGHSIYRTEPNLMLQVQTHSAGFCLLSTIATYKNSNPCYWERYTQERESEVVTQSVTPCWLNLAALVCFSLKHPRVSWFSIMTIYMNKWITWEKKLINAPPRPFDFQPARRATTAGQTCICPLEVSLSTITSSLFFHS